MLETLRQIEGRRMRRLVSVIVGMISDMSGVECKMIDCDVAISILH